LFQLVVGGVVRGATSAS